jgi:outer membrane murein-binding lipoprotein Lpp
MIDPSFDTQSVETVPPFPPTMQELETKIDQLNNALASMTADRDFWQARAHDRQMMIDNLEEYVKEQYDYIDEEISQSLVDIFGLSITKDYDVTVTVTFSGTVTVPLNYDMDNLENDLNASLESHYYSADVEADFSEDRMEIDWSES